MKTLTLALSFVLAAAPALAGPVTLKANPADDDGRVTLGDVFDGAGSAADVVIAHRAGPSVVFESGQLQGLALRSGLQWSNPQGLRRVVVRQGVASATTTIAASAAARPGATADVLTYARNLVAGDVIQPEDVVWTQIQAHQVNASGPEDAAQVIGLSARRALRAGSPVAARDLASPQVIARNDTVEVAFVSGGVKLTVMGRATRNAAIGEPVPVLNLASGKTIEAIATGPGRAITGPAAQLARSNSNQFARLGN